MVEDLTLIQDFTELVLSVSVSLHLTDDERDTAFWCGFHPDDHIRLLPYSPDIPPHFEDVFTKARTVFSYKPEPVYMPIPSLLPRYLHPSFLRCPPLNPIPLPNALPKFAAPRLRPR
jgi:hypothetical protein